MPEPNEFNQPKLALGLDFFFLTGSPDNVLLGFGVVCAAVVDPAFAWGSALACALAACFSSSVGGETKSLASIRDQPLLSSQASTQTCALACRTTIKLVKAIRLPPR